MLLLAALPLLTAPVFAPPVPWTLGFAAPPFLPLAADVDGDGYADLISVSTQGEGFIDVMLNVAGMKTARAGRARSQWGKGCQAAAAGEFDGKKGADVVGIFDGQTLMLASDFKSGAFQSGVEWLKLPKKLDKPRLIWLEPGKVVVQGKGGAFAISLKDKAAVPFKGRITEPLKGIETLLPPSGLPDAPRRFALGDMDADGDEDVIEFRNGNEHHTAQSVRIYRKVSPGETDSDRDGLPNTEEAKLGTDPMNPDTDADGLLDGWEVGEFRGLKLQELGCDPRHTDFICLISRFDGLDETLAKEELARCVDYYAKLPTKNPDGKTGWSLHPIWLNVLDKEAQKKPWWESRDLYIPAKWRGVVHWMQITPWGGGQADQLGDGGGCGGGRNSLYATFLHEFGHQIGMDHNGFWGPSQCPIYRSLMNYAYSYSLEDDATRIAYSTGELADFVLRENDLSEVLPLPYERAKFLERGPYRFKLKPNGKTTLIDWNWNGVLGETHIRADINYGYSTSAGARDDAGKTMASPWWIINGRDAFLLYAKHDKPADPKSSPDVSVEKPGTLYLRKLLKPKVWRDPWIVEKEAVTGDPVGITVGKSLVFAYPTKNGVVLRTGELKGDSLRVSDWASVHANTKAVPTVGTANGRAYLLLWNHETKAIQYAILPAKPTKENLDKLEFHAFRFTSEIAPGFCEDTIQHQVVIGIAQDQDAQRKSRWQVRRLNIDSMGLLTEASAPEWVEGEAGRAAGNSRCTLLFDASKDAGKEGRLYFFAVGFRAKENPWQCGYVAMQLADRSIRGGWLVKRYYDEWTQSRSSVGVAWWQGEILYAYRWVDGSQGPTDNNLHVGYRGSGIDPEPMGDHDDLKMMGSFGIRYSIGWLNKE
ncbi:MAG: hypothetical protein HZC36_10145 [Armatimonadetes bacterium]|nr:hypothetical protein [Armatimonadota bacterium]